MVQGTDVVAPEEVPFQPVGEGSSKGQVMLRKELGLMEGVAIILGIIIGSGIFISPKGVLEEAGSYGFALIVWAMCGVLSLIGALCYAELGTTVPKSGGDYAYIREAYGPLPSFLYLWAANVVFVPTTNAIMALTFAKYVLQPFFPTCEVPDESVRLLAAASICFLTFLNSYTVKVTTKMQDVFMFAKVGALVIIIIAGIYHMSMGNVQNFERPFHGSSTEPGKVAVSFYAGIFSYAGWNYLNFMTEELKDPYKNLPRAIYLSLPLVTVVYLLANISYMAVLSANEMKASDAIAFTFGEQILGVMYWIMPLFVAVSAFGGLSVHIMTSSRLCFVGAREGLFPTSLATIDVKRYTPSPSLVFLGLLSLVYLCTSDIFALIEYTAFVESMFICCSVSGLIYMRWKRPQMKRPIRFNIAIPITFFLICTFLVILPLYVRPLEVGMGILITASGIPAYLIFVYWKNKPKWFSNALDNFTIAVQKLFMAVKEE